MIFNPEMYMGVVCCVVFAVAGLVLLECFHGFGPGAIRHAGPKRPRPNEEKHIRRSSNVAA
jgi:hypothetical protein